MWGYTPEQAGFLSKVCYLTAVSACGAIGATLDPSMKSLAGDGDEKPCRLSARARSDVFDLPNRWHGSGSDGARAPVILFSAIQRRLPAP